VSDVAKKVLKKALWQIAVVRKMTKTFYRPTQRMIRFKRLFYKFTYSTRKQFAKALRNQ
jgi:hypothetical protein